MTGKHARDSEVVLSQLMLPTDANPQGNVHGGTIMKLIDTAGGMCAVRHARTFVVTAEIDSITFLSPVYVGNLVTLRAHLNWVGRTSMEVEVCVEAENPLTGEITHTNSAYAVYVALDAGSKPKAVPPLIIETDEERRRWAEAEARRAHRLAMKQG
ncbi:MAG: acyl-CoA thioesterase [Chloroflexi bacterium]|nr:acyl-CoA thioesterase [Chloroflexota bacterium]